jgi:putative DNA primase/helicase
VCPKGIGVRFADNSIGEIAVTTKVEANKKTTEAIAVELNEPPNGVNAAPASGRAKLEECPSAILRDEVYECSEFAEQTAWWSKPAHKVLDAVVSGIGILLGIGDDIVTILASTITPQKVRWLWPNRIPLGKITLFVGNPDNGKSMVGTYVTAVTTTGRDWCDEATNTVPPSEVLVFAGEDDAEDTSVPRLIAADANLNKVRFAKMTTGDPNAAQSEREMRLDTDIGAMRKALKENPRIRLIIIDPVSNYLGNSKMVDEQSVRRLLAPLQILASETGVAILGIMHLNKKGDLKAIHRVGGAMAFVGVARAVWLFAADEEQKNMFHMLRLKKNIGARNGGLMYRIASKPIEIEGEGVPQPCVEWLGETEKSADSILTPKAVGRPKTERQAGAEWLKNFLGQGPQPSVEVEAEGEAAGFSYRTLERAMKEDIGVRKVKRGDRWYWELAEEVRPPES